ncbi:TPA: hypothetical protein ONV50_001239 [Enterococcus faecium]|uniref:hypothetical protein n=1 Tax=Enterococcus TaxID=1350 RepID=UPI000665ABB9|nr:MULTISPECIES: hypothetical protein [Enterococcus]AQT58136.1 hypothetical protein BVA20_02734 [Enterococcus faecium]AQY29455.1 hypothetical protein B4W80_11225 [Enterococcus faecium]AQY31761.1 hypothetical protein B4W81_07105 [Enterococcus faecium]MBQ1101754.1 hypothetical protein [Enterococcus faecium]MBQ1127607.1 hypothetical protein [Enterococcus faecium]
MISEPQMNNMYESPTIMGAGEAAPRACSAIMVCVLLASAGVGIQAGAVYTYAVVATVAVAAAAVWKTVGLVG